MNTTEKIGFGGGCHWCTEAVFQHLKGIETVEQGWIASQGEDFAFAEAVIVHYNPEAIPLKILIEIHLHTHKSTSNHSMREKYRSGIYTYSDKQQQYANDILAKLQPKFNNKLITKVYPFKEFKTSREQIQNYYKKNPQKPFCETFINPKLKLLLEHYSSYTKKEELKHLDN